MTTLADILAGKTPAPAPTFTDVAPATTPFPVVDLALPLYDFQREAVEHALRPTKGAPYAYCGLEMGLGKTPVGISVIASHHGAKGGRALVVVPPSLRLNWQREFGKFAPWLSVAVLTGTKPDVLPDVDVLIIGDSTIVHWADALKGRIDCLIVDEAHRHKNGKSKRAIALANIASTVRGAVVLLSGTPIPNGRHIEWASQIDVLGKQAWNDIGGLGTFWGRFCPKVDHWGGRGNAESDVLHSLLVGSWFFYRRRDAVIDLPNKGRSGVAMQCEGKAMRDYIRAENDLIAWLADEGFDTRGAERAEALVRLGKLRYLGGMAKVNAIVERTKEVLDDSTGGVFVVAEHKDVMDALLIKLAKYNPVTVRGGMNDSAKQEAVDAFCDGTSRVLVGQITSAGVGLTLHGDGLNHHVIVAQLPWTPADLRQAEDRLHRIGQTNDVMVEVALAHIDGRWTIDERLWSMLETKHFATGVVLEGVGENLLEDIQTGVLDSYR